MPSPRPPKPLAGQRIAKLLARAGIASRREIERMIADRRIALAGEVIDTPATLLASLDGVTVDGNPVEAAAPARLFLYHKPAGLLVTEHDPAGRPTIYDRLPPGLPRLVPVGRLDLATEGLLLLTTDGELKRELELPATGVERAYRARAYGPVTQAQLETLIEGVEIEGVRYGSIDANLERRTGTNSWIEMILTEGRNREVRRVLEYLGLRVSRLIRTRYGPFVLGDLPAGEIGEVRQHDVAAFRRNPTRNPPPEHAGRRRRSASPRPSPVTIAPRGDGRTERAAAPKAPAPRITRAAADAADRAAFTDARPPDDRAAPARPRRFYDAGPPRERADRPAGTNPPRDGAAPARPARVFNAALQRNVRGKPVRPAQGGGEAMPRSAPAGRPDTPPRGRPSGGARPPRARPPRPRG